MIRFCVFLLWGSIVGGISFDAAASETPVELANPLVGTAALDNPEWIGNAPPPGEEIYTGLVWPGPAYPHREVLLNPVNKDLETADDGHGIICPYIYQRQTMVGFSSMVPGMLIMPLVGDWTTPPDRSYAPAYDKSSEKASPGFYSVYFPSEGVRVDLTTTEHTGLYRFTYPKTERGMVLLDLGPEEASIKIVDDHTIGGHVRGGRYFVAEFSKPFKSFGTFHQNIPSIDNGHVRRGDTINPGGSAERGSYAGCYLNYSTAQGEQVLVKIASARSVGEAEEKIQSENPGWDFDGVRKRVEDAWSDKLNLIQIEGGTQHDREFFYSAFYHSLYSPRLIAKAGTPFRGEDHQMHTVDYDRYTPIPFWDTGRDQITLLMLLEPDLVTNVLRTHLEMAKESGWMHTSFHGDNAVFLYLGAWECGIPFDWPAVYPYLRKNAMDPAGPRGYLDEYLKRGWIHDDIVDHPSPPYAGGNAGVATTLEYSWDDYDMALYAKKLGMQDDYQMFLARAHNYTNVFDATIGFMRGRNEDGSWISPFDPQEPYYNFMMKEASGWQTLWLVPGDVQGLINLLGGRDAFCKKLDDFFSRPYHPKGIARDVTGIFGAILSGQPARPADAVLLRLRRPALENAGGDAQDLDGTLWQR
jgi:predicted alpha-1,2-mannosidase